MKRDQDGIPYSPVDTYRLRKGLAKKGTGTMIILNREFRIIDMRNGTFVVQERNPFFAGNWVNTATCESIEAAEAFVSKEIETTPRIVREYP